MELKEIYSELENIRQKLDLIRIKIENLYASRNRFDIDQKKWSLFEEERTLEDKKSILEEELFFALPPLKCNSLIDLRHKLINSNTYSIYLHNTRSLIGEISYQGYHFSDFFGDIGYSIFPEFRGNNYAYQALVLLSEKLSDDGIPDFWIGVYTDNVPSIKTIEKFGGKLIKNNYDRALLFQCSTQRKMEFDNSTVSRK